MILIENQHWYRDKHQHHCNSLFRFNKFQWEHDVYVAIATNNRPIMNPNLQIQAFFSSEYPRDVLLFSNHWFSFSSILHWNVTFFFSSFKVCGLDYFIIKWSEFMEKRWPSCQKKAHNNTSNPKCILYKFVNRINSHWFRVFNKLSARAHKNLQIFPIAKS